MFPIFAGNSASTGYNLTRSLRWRNSASAYLNRTPASATNRQTWTYSAWVKLTPYNPAVGGYDSWLLTTKFNGVAPYATTISINTNYKLVFASYDGSGGSPSLNLVTTQVFRDYSSWYHIVVVADTTQATAANRAKLYVNGVQITSFSTATYPSQNYNTYVNNNDVTALGALYYSGGGPYSYLQFLDSYMAEFNLVDGQALTPSSFGSTNSLTGVWQPARYTGSYGTNGFYLPFTDNSALTTSSNVGLGKDFSGNANYWATNNISITAGVTYDSMTDVPTLTSATAANFAVMNPLEHPATFVAPTNANLTQNCNTGAWTLSVPTINIPNGSGLWQWEFVQTGTANGANAFGVCLSTVSATTTGDPSARAGCSGVSNASGAFINGSTSGSITYPTTGTIVTCLYDATNLTFQVFENGTSKGTITGLPSGNVRAFVAASSSNGSPTFDMNFGQRPFGYDKSGKALNTFNLPTSTIVKGNTVMDATLYTGTGSALTITNAAPFKPDLVWIKVRSNAISHALTDSVRGISSILSSDLTSAQATQSVGQGLTAFNSNGFSLGTQCAGSGDTNFSGRTYVGWQWQAGQGSTSSNTNGTITSTVSVNASAGFSVVTFSTPAVYSSGSVGHGLGVTPSMFIVKNRNGAANINWNVYHQSLGNTQAIYLNLTNAASTSSTFWNNTSPTSSVFTVGANLYNSSDMVAYCWTPIAGFSAFGSLTGNGSADGVFVYLGFKPRFILYKRTDSTSNWRVWDTARTPYNAMSSVLYPDASDAEFTASSQDFDALSNGFKIRNSSASMNASGGTYIYAAFSSNPFKNSLAV